jgi:hypothetical protein
MTKIVDALLPTVVPGPALAAPMRGEHRYLDRHPEGR